MHSGKKIEIGGSLKRKKQKTTTKKKKTTTKKQEKEKKWKLAEKTNVAVTHR